MVLTGSGKRHVGWVLLSAFFIFSFALSQPARAAEAAPMPVPAVSNTLASAPRTLSTDTVLEQGKAYYDNGQYFAALDKFMKVLRRDPQQREARQYLRMVVDQMRNQHKNTPALNTPIREMTESVPAPVLEEEVRQRVRKRQLLTLDLGAIPGVNVRIDEKQAQVEIDSKLLFADKSGGLREEGIPILDRVAAWLKTFGQQPVELHCYPEELDTSGPSGSLFVHRYAQLYGFFVDEQKMSAARFVNAGLPKEQEAASEASRASVTAASGTPRAVIVSLGGGMTQPEDVPPTQVPRWLEFSISSMRQFFSPQEGDWASLDLAALGRKGVRMWYFNILPADSRTGKAGRRAQPVLSMEGKGNLLKRVSWDGRHQKTGSFVAPGNYLCRLTATDAEGATLTNEMTLKVHRAGASPMEMAQKPKPAVQPQAKPKPKPKPKAKPVLTHRPEEDAMTAPSSVTAAGQAARAPVQPVRAAASQVPADSAAAEADDVDKETDLEAPADSAEPDNSVHAIWKQVIQFDDNESDLKPTLKASLERIGKTLEVYPLQKVRIVGFAEKSEQNASSLARQRADMVRETLINEYQVDAKRVIVAGGRVGSGSAGHAMSKVEISITN